jgi:hypothetical protein
VCIIDLSPVPSWAWWIAAGLLAALIAVGAYYAVRSIYRRLSRRYLVQVVGRREGVLASRRTLEAVVRHLADEDDAKLQHFASHPEDEDRRALTEVARRMEIAAEELDTMPLPRSLWPAAMALADAAYIIGKEAGRVGETADPAEVFSSLANVDIARARDQFEAADAMVKEAAERFDLDEAAVYGGGLYI